MEYRLGIVGHLQGGVNRGWGLFQSFGVGKRARRQVPGAERRSEDEAQQGNAGTVVIVHRVEMEIGFGTG